MMQIPRAQRRETGLRNDPNRERSIHGNFGRHTHLRIGAADVYPSWVNVWLSKEGDTLMHHLLLAPTENSRDSTSSS